MFLRLHAHKSVQQTKFAGNILPIVMVLIIVSYNLCMKVKVILMLRQEHHEDV